MSYEFWGSLHYFIQVATQQFWSFTFCDGMGIHIKGDFIASSKVFNKHYFVCTPTVA